jgi:Histidine kinase-, DNA gyrase B-, and HSP90-like ATPase
VRHSGHFRAAPEADRSPSPIDLLEDRRRSSTCAVQRGGSSGLRTGRWFGATDRQLPKVENAARHACRTIKITGHDGAGTVVIAIRDDGPGIPEDQLYDALKRGGRLDSSDSGTGLGLAIVSDIAAAWNATLNLKNTGRGLLAELRLCSADQEATSKNSEADRGSGDRPRRDQSVSAHR